MPVNKSPPSSRTTSPKAVSPTVSPPNSPPRKSRAGTDASQQENAARHDEPRFFFAKAVLEYNNQERVFVVCAAPGNISMAIAIEGPLNAAQPFNPDDAYAKLINSLATCTKALQLDVKLKLGKTSYQGCPLSMSEYIVTKLPLCRSADALLTIENKCTPIALSGKSFEATFRDIQISLNEKAGGDV